MSQRKLSYLERDSSTYSKALKKKTLSFLHHLVKKDKKSTQHSVDHEPATPASSAFALPIAFGIFLLVESSSSFGL